MKNVFIMHIIKEDLLRPNIENKVQVHYQTALSNLSFFRPVFSTTKIWSTNLELARYVRLST